MASFGRYKVHPLADEFPLMEGNEFDLLVASIDRQGLQEMIVLAPDGETIVDGRNRYRACEKAGRDPVFRTLEPHYTEARIIDYIVAANIERRHLTLEERGFLADTVIDAKLAVEAKERQRAAGGDKRSEYAKRTSVGPQGAPPITKGKAAEKAAEQLGVSKNTVKRARKIRKVAPELEQEVRQGRTSMTAAYQEARRREREEQERQQTEQEQPTEDFQLVPPPHNGGRAQPTGTVLLPTHQGEEIPYPVPKAKATFNETPGEGISWAAWSWNPVTGCLHGCVYCYARDIATSERAKAGFPVGFTPLFHHERLDAPANTHVPAKHRGDPAYRRVFVCSMADLYGQWVPDDWIDQVHESMLANPEWQYILLTKFPTRYTRVQLPPRAWVGTSIDEQSRVRKAEDAFRKIDGVAVKWLSLEPLLEPLEFTDLSMFDWVVIGAQTETHQPDGIVPAFKPPDDWVVRLAGQAIAAGCKVHWKPNLGKVWLNQYPEVPA